MVNIADVAIGVIFILIVICWAFTRSQSRRPVTMASAETTPRVQPRANITETNTSLVNTMETFQHGKEVMRRLYSNFQTYSRRVIAIYGKYCKPEEKGNLVLISDIEGRRIEKILNEEPAIVVSGRMNCGKTSLINELLECDLFTTKAIPSTARMTTVMFSVNNFLRIRRTDGSIVSETNFTGNTVPEKLMERIDLTHDKRQDENQVRCVVEVGFNHPLLKAGLKIVDLPGLDESETMESIASDTLDCMLQVLVYVIDADNSLSQEDVKFMTKLKQKSPSLDNVIYVCNKTELDECAQKYDKPDDGSDEDYAEKFDQKKRAQLKRSLSVEKIKKSSLLPIRANCFHAISCKKVKKARVKKGKKRQQTTTKSVFEENFDQLRNELVKQYQTCLRRDVTQAAKMILAAQMKLHDMVHEETDLLQRFLDGMNASLERVSEKFTYIQTCVKGWPVVVQKCLRERSKLAELEKAACTYHLRDRIRDESMDAYKDHCRTELCKLAGIWFIETPLESTLTTLLNKFKAEVKDDVFEFHVADDMKHSYDFITNRLVMKGEIVISEDENIWKKKAIKLVAIFLSMTVCQNGIVRDGRIDNNWRMRTSNDILNGLNVETIAEIIIKSLVEQINEQHRVFLKARATTQFLQGMIDTVKNVGIRGELLPSDSCFSEDCYLSRALVRTMNEGTIDEGEVIAKGTTCIVTAAGDGVVAKRFKNEQITKEICLRHSYVYFGSHVDGLVQLKDVALDHHWRQMYLLKRYGCRLDDALKKGLTFSLSQRLHALLRVCKTICQLIDQGLIIRQVYPSYFLVEDRCDELVVDYNLLKVAPHNETEVLSKQLGKLLAAMFHGRYDNIFPVNPDNQDCLTLLRVDSNTEDNEYVREKLHAIFVQYIFCEDEISADIFTKDLERFIGDMKTHFWIED